MFSYLQGKRPTGRRNQSSPTLPSQKISSRKNYDSGMTYLRDYHGDKLRSPAPKPIQTKSISSTNPYTLPPIPRVASRHDPHFDLLSSEEDLSDSPFQSRKPYQNINSFVGDDDDDDDGRSSRAQVLADKIEAEGSEQEIVPMLAAPEIPSSHPSDVHPKPVRPYKSLFRSYTGSFTPSRESLVGNPSPSPQSQNFDTLHTEQSSSSATTQTRSGKMKLNILNPMSLLARRRSAQVAATTNSIMALSRNVSVPLMKLPDDYDPRIRGNVVHDFSAPRSGHQAYSSHSGPPNFANVTSVRSPYQNEATNEIHLRDIKSTLGEISIQGQSTEVPIPSDRAHTPIFKEHFGVESEPWQFDEEDRRNQQTRSIMDHVPEMDHSDSEVSLLPPFARRLPDMVSNSPSISETSPSILPSAPLGVVSEDDMPEPQNNLCTYTSPPTSPPKTRSCATSTTDSSFQPVGLPKHFKSNASRFSFDLAGVGSSAQEQLLEEKHRQQSAQKALVNSTDGTAIQDIEDDDGFFYDESEEFEGLEERIPGVNTDADDEVNLIDTCTNTVLDPILTKWPTVSPIFSKTNHHDESKPSHNILQEASSLISISSLPNTSGEERFSDRQFPFYKSENTHLNEVNGHPMFSCHSHAESDEEDDLYFDDGIIDDIDNIDGPTFDESVFDDDTNKILGLPIRDQKKLSFFLDLPNAVSSQRSIASASLDKETMPASHQQIEDGAQSIGNSISNSSAPMYIDSSAKNKSHSRSYNHQSVSLTQDNLAAYHHALAHATNQAALSGKFDRESSISSSEHESSPVRVPQDTMMFDGPPDDNGENYESNSIHNLSESFNFDDNIEDDSIIAAANAEALENDDEGFYGQEFGFFARATGSGEAEYVNGGYFGAAGADGVRRSHSGRANFQEPSLTPITERSEWSNRNSVVSPTIAGGYPQSLQSAGLAQLTNDAILLEEEHMSLSALMRLRRGAWGSSNVSLPSSAGSHKSGSSQIYLPPIPSSGTPSYELDGLHYTSSDHSLSSLTSIEESHSNSPTLKIETQENLINSADRSWGSESSPNRWNAVKVGGLGHSRKSSGAESVSYVKDVSEEGSERWVLEKRRTFEGGKVEVLGREVVEGGRI